MFRIVLLEIKHVTHSSQFKTKYHEWYLLWKSLRPRSSLFHSYLLGTLSLLHRRRDNSIRMTEILLGSDSSWDRRTLLWQDQKSQQAAAEEWSESSEWLKIGIHWWREMRFNSVVLNSKCAQNYGWGMWLAICWIFNTFFVSNYNFQISNYHIGLLIDVEFEYITVCCRYK